METNDVQNQEPGGYEYRIRVDGRISPKWADWFGDMQIREEGETTLLEGVLPDQSAVYGILNNLSNLNLPLISVERRVRGS